MKSKRNQLLKSWILQSVRLHRLVINIFGVFINKNVPNKNQGLFVFPRTIGRVSLMSTLTKIIVFAFIFMRIQKWHPFMNRFLIHLFTMSRLLINRESSKPNQNEIFRGQWYWSYRWKTSRSNFTSQEIGFRHWTTKITGTQRCKTFFLFKAQIQKFFKVDGYPKSKLVEHN